MKRFSVTEVRGENTAMGHRPDLWAAAQMLHEYLIARMSFVQESGRLSISRIRS
jgi:hypothetical protein